MSTHCDTETQFNVNLFIITTIQERELALAKQLRVKYEEVRKAKSIVDHLVSKSIDAYEYYGSMQTPKDVDAALIVWKNASAAALDAMNKKHECVAALFVLKSKRSIKTKQIWLRIQYSNYVGKFDTCPGAQKTYMQHMMRNAVLDGDPNGNVLVKSDIIPGHHIARLMPRNELIGYIVNLSNSMDELSTWQWMN